ncbi:MAG: GIY-YIG nuclease family protein [Gammaproteobacteria bacterium]|nr:GIY-YIG nuclease family protein [Gammaproteobacteria bacterium]
MNQPDIWYVYILECSDKSLYTGITNNVERRISEHNDSSIGAKYTRARRPVNLVYQEECMNRSVASKREMEIKKLRPEKKRGLINQTT